MLKVATNGTSTLYGLRTIMVLHKVNGPITDHVLITDRNVFWGYFSLKSLAEVLFTWIVYPKYPDDISRAEVA